MTQIVQLPLWLFILIVLFAAVTALSHFLIPSVRWFFRRRFERAVARLNTRLTRPIEPFKLAQRHDMIQRLIYDPEVTREIVNYAQENGVPENVAFQKAQEYAREIVPGFSAFAYFSFAMRIARLLANAVYRIKTSDKNDDILAGIPQESTVVFIMNHRSNMDYVLVTYLASRATTMSYAVGEWARVWPLSMMIKLWGAYFIRRKSRGALYRKVLARYVHMATHAGVTQAIFPEGGLSVTGALQPPKMGLLAYVVEAYEADSSRDLVFVPVAINYDRVLEDRVLIAAGKRGDRRFGARISVVVFAFFKKFWQRVRGKDTRFGSAAVAFGTPLSLADAQMTDVDALSTALIDRISDVMPILAVPLIATVLLRDQRVEVSEMVENARALMEQAPPQNRTSENEDLGAEVQRGLIGLKRRDIIELDHGYWQIKAGGEDVLAFYARSVAHLLPENAAVAKVLSATAKS
ncbi:1-acyl-sn-glycerol-3-phosphate acyltransferase [Sulfitobacter sp. TSTF-M16]|uniref:Glycerol-3-phosphate acyltransferase n=1 Tax=Sulfitobacter aestuariivivens TaxID=2766981 RepID=A0A927HF21_9RHOB|nr:1-acyl-sn-glycerol-3-phosphate acyltransferase [Sulfitobacter aestuariivivens]MBD3663984.1 1-acyl-sn-glycerol-3-phosphate acyltransferase [Sulfitobacter aestuariivivens]